MPDVSFLQWRKHAARVGTMIEREFPEVWRWMGRVEEAEGVMELASILKCVMPDVGYYITLSVAVIPTLLHINYGQRECRDACQVLHK